MAIYKNTPPIVTNGLILHLDAGSRQSYVSGSTTWSDLSGNRNSGSLLVSGSGPVSASFDSTNQGSIRFSGTGSYVNCGIPLSFTSSFSLNFYFKTTVTNTVCVMTGIYSGSGADWFGAIGSDNKFIFSFGSPSKVDLSSLSTINDGAWKLASCIYDKSINSSFLYINGILQSSTSAIPSVVTQPGGNLMISKFGDFYTFYFPGSIAVYQIYNRALSAQEVAQNYNALKSRFGLT